MLQHSRRLVLRSTTSKICLSQKQNTSKIVAGVATFSKPSARVTARKFHSNALKNTETNTQNFEENEKANHNLSSEAASRELKNQILEIAVNKYVDAYGWTIEAISSAAQDLGYSSMLHGLFPRGATELVHYVVQKGNRHMADAMRNLLADPQAGSTLSPREITKKAIQIRLEYVAPFVKKGIWADAMALYLFGKSSIDVNPLSSIIQNSTQAMYQAAILADEICYLARQYDTDFEWYAKRGAIASIYAATELYMLTDKSDNFAQTWQFLNNRVDEALCVKHQLDSLFGSVGLLVRSFTKFN